MAHLLSSSMVVATLKQPDTMRTAQTDNSGLLPEACEEIDRVVSSLISIPEWWISCRWPKEWDSQAGKPRFPCHVHYFSKALPSSTWPPATLTPRLHWRCTCRGRAALYVPGRGCFWTRSKSRNASFWITISFPAVPACFLGWRHLNHLATWSAWHACGDFWVRTPPVLFVPV